MWQAPAAVLFPAGLCGSHQICGAGRGQPALGPGRGSSGETSLTTRNSFMVQLLPGTPGEGREGARGQFLSGNLCLMSEV